MFVVKKAKSVTEESLKEVFQEIKISTWNLFTDPVANLFLPLRSCSSFACRKRARILETAAEKLSEELNIEHMLDKIKNSCNMLRQFEDRELLRLTRDRVIKLYESDDSGDEVQVLSPEVLRIKTSIKDALYHQVFQIYKKQGDNTDAAIELGNRSAEFEKS
jgi:hypothetical protein